MVTSYPLPDSNTKCPVRSREPSVLEFPLNSLAAGSGADLLGVGAGDWAPPPVKSPACRTLTSPLPLTRSCPNPQL